MTITKKHLNELATIVQEIKQVCDKNNDSIVLHLELRLKIFARRYAPNFDESKWTDYMHKLKKIDEETMRKADEL